MAKKKNRKKRRKDPRRHAYQVLADFLASDYTPDDCMNLTAAHGLMTSVVIGPRLIMPSRWLPVLFGERGEQRVKYINIRHARKINELVMGMYNEIVKEFTEYDGEYFLPLLAMEGQDLRQAAFLSLKEWCGGFMEGVIMELEAWSQLTEDDENSWLMDTLLLFGTHEGLKEAERLSDDQVFKKMLELPEALVEIYLYWLERREYDAPVGYGDPLDGLPI
jgi:uncharacterized protein